MADAASIHLEMFEAVQTFDFDRLRDLYHADYEYSGSDGTVGGIDVGVGVAETYTRAFPDLTFAIDHQTSCGDTSVIELTARGTHQGELEGIAPTGKAVEVVVCNIIDVKDGKVYREREYFNALSMMQQLGVIPEG
jgi:predicted ester cyclase